jgi:proteasome alpha subunit
MTMPFYVAPEQVMKDRAEYAQKGIARGRSLIATVYADGVLIVAENPSRSLHKISEIYDRIAFGGVGKYNEYDQLRVAGVRHADTKGFAFSREDVDARSLANLYAQFLGNVFTHELKPLEVEILVAEVGVNGRPDQLYHIAYEGTITDEDRFAVLGGDAETIAERVGADWREGLSRDEAVRALVRALAGPDRTLGPGDLEVAMLSRANGRRAFRRVTNGELEGILSGSPGTDDRQPSQSSRRRSVRTSGGEDDQAAVAEDDAAPPPG